MNKVKALEETFRESACIGDVDTIEELLSKGINVNAKHDINGWTALHWAAKRGHREVVSVLLDHGADKLALTLNGEVPSALCKNSEVLRLLDSDGGSPAASLSLPITPNYLKYPPLNAKVENSGKPLTLRQSAMQNDELVLKVRVAHGTDTDFIEVELPRDELTFSRLLRTCCEELNVAPAQVFRVRKLPDTIVRKDKDVQRMKDFQALEIVMTADPARQAAGGPVNGYQSISQNKGQTILY